MPRSNGEINQNQAAVRGIITEASPLNFPEGATLDEENFVLRRDGSRRRRRGLGVENGGSSQAINSSDVVTVFPWFNAGEDSDQDYVVIQIGDTLYVYGANSQPLSDGFVDSIAITDWTGRKIEADVINGDLIYAQGGSKVVRVSINSGVLSDISYDLQVRDLWGIDDALAVDERPSTLENDHAYNLANQGWLRADVNAVNTEVGDYPSNADIYATGTEGTSFNAGLYNKVEYGNTPSAKGSAIINPLAPSDGREQRMEDRGFGVDVNTALYNDRTTLGATAVGSYAGRVFYAGFGKATNRVNDTYPDLNGYILFSQTIQDNEDFRRCYQDADPSNLSGDLVDSDGGFISIPSAGQIVKLIPTGRSLLVLSTEGVWEIYSTDQIFSPLNYQLQKITNIGATSKDSVIVAQDVVFYWSDYGIQVLATNEVAQVYTAQNITENTIQSLYDDLSEPTKSKSIGYFDRFDKKVRWLYDSQARDNIYDSELIYDLSLQAWYKNSFAIKSDGTGVSHYLPLPAAIKEDQLINVVADADNVVADADNVVFTQSDVVVGERSFKYLNKAATTMDFVEFNNASFSDWSETDAKAFALTGHYTGGDTVREKQVTYLTMHFNRTETGFTEDENGDWLVVNPSSCLTRVRWDWTNDIVAGKFTNQFEAYRHKRVFFPDSLANPFNDGYPVVTTKNRIRGRGKAMNVYFETSPEKDLNILGWNFQIGVNSKV